MTGGKDQITSLGIILGVGSGNERRRYIVPSSLTDWTHAQNDPIVWGEIRRRSCFHCARYLRCRVGLGRCCLAVMTENTITTPWSNTAYSLESLGNSEIYWYPIFERVVWLTLLHSPSLVSIRLSKGYETWPQIGWHHPFVIGWSKYMYIDWDCLSCNGL